MEKIFPHVAASFLMMLSLVFTIRGITDSSLAVEDRIVSTLEALPILAIIPGLYLFFIREARKRNSFLAFVANNRLSLLKGEPSSYNEVEIDLKTQVTCFEACLSFIFPWPWGVKIASAYYIEGQPGRFRAAVLCSIISLLFGWLGVWTVVWQISTLIRNIGGGYKQTVSELLSPIEDVTDAKAGK